MIDPIQIIQTIFSPAAKLVKWAYHRLRILIFHFINRKPPLDESKARQIAHSILSGNIVQAIAYRNINSKHIFIAAIRRTSEDDYDSRIYILEQLGNTYMSIWNSEPILATAPLKAEDIDGDGINEVILIEKFYGTGGGAEVMSVYSSRQRQLFQIKQHYDWQDAAGPVAPQIEVEPESEGGFLEALERYALKEGFLQSHLADLNSPDFAVQRWHASNGRKKSGVINLHFYNGSSSYLNSISATLDTEDILWTAYFKGPLVGYIKSENRHFVAYSPESVYNWAKCLTYDGKRLWFGTHSCPGLLYFYLEENCGYLSFYTHYLDEKLPEVNKIIIFNNKIVLNDEIMISLDELGKLTASRILQ